MTFIRHFNKDHNFVYSECVGTLDDHDLRVHVLSFQVESKGMEFVRELLDLRRLQKADKLTVQGLIEISELERQRSTDRDFRLAIVANQSLFVQLARIYALVITTGNLKVEIFEDDVDGALSWLGYNGSRKVRLSAFIRRHREEPANAS